MMSGVERIERLTLGQMFSVEGANWTVLGGVSCSGLWVLALLVVSDVELGMN